MSKTPKQGNLGFKMRKLIVIPGIIFDPRYNGKQGKVSGWGLTSFFFGTFPTKLQQTIVTILVTITVQWLKIIMILITMTPKISLMAIHLQSASSFHILIVAKYLFTTFDDHPWQGHWCLWGAFSPASRGSTVCRGWGQVPRGWSPSSSRQWWVSGTHVKATVVALLLSMRMAPPP